MKTFRSGTPEWYEEEKRRLNPACQNCDFNFTNHTCQHTTSFFRHECHLDKNFNRHACPDPNNPLGVLPAVNGKCKAAPKPNGQFGWFKGEQYVCSTTYSGWGGCDNCGRITPFNTDKPHGRWAGYFVCQECMQKLHKGELTGPALCQFSLDPEELRSRLRNLYAKETDIDQLAYDVETLFGEHGYRRMSNDEDIRNWIWHTKAYTSLFSKDEMLVLHMTNVHMIIKTRIK